MLEQIFVPVWQVLNTPLEVPVVGTITPFILLCFGSVGSFLGYLISGLVYGRNET